MQDCEKQRTEVGEVVCHRHVQHPLNWEGQGAKAAGMQRERPGIANVVGGKSARAQ